MQRTNRTAHRGKRLFKVLEEPRKSNRNLQTLISAELQNLQYLVLQALVEKLASNKVANSTMADNFEVYRKSRKLIFDALKQSK